MSAERKNGRPRKHAEVMRNVTVRLSDEEIAWAKFLGGGENLSAGIRLALSRPDASADVRPAVPAEVQDAALGQI